MHRFVTLLTAGVFAGLLTAAAPAQAFGVGSLPLLTFPASAPAIDTPARGPCLLCPVQPD